MAYHTKSSFVFLFTIFIFFTTSSHSRIIPKQDDEHFSITTLDVSSSLQQAQELLSFTSLQQEETIQTEFQGSSFSIPLIPRHQLYRPNHKDYKSLVLSRLARDSARVNSLNTKLVQLLNKNVNMNNITNFDDQAFTTPLVSGSTQGSGEYFARIGLGSPAKQYSMVIDTGSDINWIQCSPCSECYTQSDPIFNPSASKTYKQLGCEAPQCGSLDVSECHAGRCMYQVSYGDGSYTTGDLVTETMSFGRERVDTVALGCGHDNEGLFVGAAGLLGLGGGKLSLTNQMKAKSFSYCLVDRDSPRSSTLDFNSVEPADAVVASMVKNSKLDTFYYIGLSGISVGGEPVAISPSIFESSTMSGEGGVIVDSGTAITRLQAQAYNALRDSFVSKTKHLKSASGIALFDTCYDLSSLKSVKVPTVSFKFGEGKMLDLPAKNYLIPVDGSGTFCFAFAPTTSSMSIIGNVQQQGIRVSFDLANSKVGFSPNKC